MSKKKTKAKETRRLSVKERTRNAKDVAQWVDTTQPSRSKKDEAVPVAERKYSSKPSSVSEESEELVEEPIKLDGGYGWVIVGFSFFLHFIADGLTFSFGQMFHAILTKFHVNRLVGGFVGSCFLAFPLGFSPFSAVFADQMGCRLQLCMGLTVSILGIIIALFGLYLDWIALFSLGFSWFLSMGLSFVYNGAIVIVTLYFGDRMGFATSLAVSGTGVGTMIFPQIIGKFEDWFPGETATAICAFALLLVLVALGICICCIRDVEWNSDDRKLFEKRVRQLDKERRYEEDVYELEEDSNMPRRCTSLPCMSTVKDIRGSIIDLGISMQSIRETVSMTKQVEQSVPRSRSVGHFMRKTLAPVPEYTMLNADDFGHLDHLDLHLGHSPANTIHSKPSSRIRMLSKTSMSVDAINDMNDDENSHRICFSDSEDDIDGDEESGTPSDSEMSNDGESSESELSDKVLNKGKVNGTAVKVTFKDDDVTPLVKTESARQARPSVTNPSQARIMAGRPGYRFNTNMLAHQCKMPSAPLLYHRKKRWYEKHATMGTMWLALTTVPAQFPLYWSILTEYPVVLLYVVSVFCLYMVLDVPYVFFYDHAVENLGIDSHLASLLTTTLGCSGLISTWVIGYLADVQWFKEKLFIVNGVAMVMMGVAIFMAAAAKTFWLMLASAMLLGAFVSSNYVLQSVLITQVFPDPSKFMPCYAMVTMFEGLATFIGPPVIGFVRDTTGNYIYVFIMAGIVLFFSGSFSFWTHHELQCDDRIVKSRSPSKTSQDLPLL